MERRTALATAAAITMGVTSALFAVGAGTGVFGSAAATAPTPGGAGRLHRDQLDRDQLGLDGRRDFRRAFRRPVPRVVEPERRAGVNPMTDQREPIDQAERLRRLQERRAASSKSPSTKGRGTMQARVPPLAGVTRRGHRASSSRASAWRRSSASAGAMLLAGNNAASVATPRSRPRRSRRCSRRRVPPPHRRPRRLRRAAAATSTKSTAAPVVHTKTRAS